MIKITVGENQADQRFDRFLRKYLPNAPLSRIYKLIRKDAKVNGARKSPEYMLRPGDLLTLYISEAEAESFYDRRERPRSKKQFSIIYEDENILAVSKPFGLLTHGSAAEKKDHLANQVVSYLVETEQYDPRAEGVFTPSPANRLDRNTTGLVLFGKTAAALRELNAMIRERECVGKYYAAIACGRIEKDMRLISSMVKDDGRNMSLISEEPGGKDMDTEIFPRKYSDADGGYTLLEIKLNTGRTHQIRLQLAQAGHPVIGDSKYGFKRVNDAVKSRYGLTTQLLHAERITFFRCRKDGPLGYLEGKSLVCPLPETFLRIKRDIFGEN